QGVQGGVEDLQAEVGNRVVLGNGELAETGAGGQALGQLELQVLKAVAANGPAEAHNGRLADAHGMGQVGHRAVHDHCRIDQNVFGDLEFGFTQQVTGLSDVLQQIHGQDSVMIGTSRVVVVL